MHYIYKITIISNGKIYVGQTQNISKRWSQHKKEAGKDIPAMVINQAMKKYGIENCKIEVIDFAQNYWQADCLEQNYIKQLDSHIKNGKGYNVSLGGPVAPKSDEWKEMMRNWHASLSPEERAVISEKQSISFTKYIEENGHIALGTKRTDEQRANISAALKALDKEAIYTEEVRRRMSEAHIGIKDSEETKQKKSESASEAWKKRIDYSRQCQAPGCLVHGKAKYKIVNGIRYCNMHGLRMLRYGRLEALMH